MEYYNITALNNELTKLENTKNNIKNSLMNKGQNIADDRPFSNYVQNIDALGTVHKFNTKAEMDVTKDLPKGTLGIVYSPYTYSNETTEFSGSIYLPKQLSYSYNDIASLENNYVLGELETKNGDLYVRASIYDDGTEATIIISLDGNMYNYVWLNNVWTRLDATKGYLAINIDSNLVYRNYTDNVGQIFQVQTNNKLSGLYQYGNVWNIMPIGMTANAETVVNGYTALTDNGVVAGVGPVGTNALAGDVWKNSVWINGQIVTGTLQVTQNVTREELDSKIDMWNTFTSFSTTSNDLSYLFNNLQQKDLPKITANNVVNIAGLYNNCRNVIDININAINTLNTINMDNTFSNCSNLNGFNLNNWRANNLQTARGMFDNCINVTSIDVTNWNVTNLKDTTSMFENCKNLTNLNVSKWNTYNVELMGKMFKNCQHMENLSFTNWNTSNVTNMEAIFESCDRFTNESIANVVNMLPDAIQLTNNNAFNLGIDMDRYNQLQLLILNQKNYIGAPLPYNMYYNIINLDDGSYYLLNKGDDLDKNGNKLYTYINNIDKLGQVYNLEIGDSLSKDATLESLSTQYQRNLYKLDITGLNLANVKSLFFSRCGKLTVLNMANSNLASMNNFGEYRWAKSRMFLDTNGLVEINMYNVNMSNIDFMSGLFAMFPLLNNLNIANWNTSKVEQMAAVFYGCNNLTNLDVSNWDTRNVINMGQLFSRCLNVKHIDVSNWNTSNVMDMGMMFDGCNNLLQIDVSNWDTSKVYTMGYMFNYCNKLTSLNVSNWNTSNVTSMSNMFYYCTNLINLDVSNWNVSKVSSMGVTFYYCNNLTNLDVSNWNTSNVTNLYATFAYCTNLTSLNVSNWNTSNVINMAMLFAGSKVNMLDVSNWNINNVRDMYCMFAYCTNLTNLDLSNWNVSNVSTMASMFANMSSNCTVNISNWNTCNVKNMGSIFYACSANIMNIESLNVSNVTNMTEMFRYSAFESLNLCNWDVSNVTTMSRMFWYMSKLTSVDISGWNIGKINSLDLFDSCKSLVNVDVSGMNLYNITNISRMFGMCNNLSNESIDSIINMCLDAANVTTKNLYMYNQFSPFYQSNISNTRFQNRWAELDAAGWTY